MADILEFVLRDGLSDERPTQVGRVHPDGSITFRGHRYPTLKEVPAACQGLRPDLDTHRQWRSLYAKIDPRGKRPRRRDTFGPPRAR